MLLKSRYGWGVVLLVILYISVAGNASGATDLNSQIEILAKKLASVVKGEVLMGKGSQVYIGIGQNQGVLPGSRFEIVRQGAPLKMGEEILGYEETPVAQAEVTRVREKVSICKVISGSANELTGPAKVGDKAYQMRKKINTLVVGQFTYNQGLNHLTKNLQEKLVTTMANLGMQVVERDQLERVLKEQKLGYSGLINMSSAKKIGELLGAEGMLLGNISDMGNAITINARMVDIESGKAVSASEVELPKTPLIAQLLEKELEEDPVTVSSTSKANKTKKQKKPSKNNPYNALQSIDVDLFTCHVVTCEKKLGGKVKIEILMVNNDNDRELKCWGKGCRLIDSEGNTFSPKDGKVLVANDWGDYEQGYKQNAGKAVFVKGVPTKCAAWFTGVSESATSAGLIEFWFTEGPKVQFRNVDFQ